MAEGEIRDPGTVTFNDVAVYFSLQQWVQMEDWQRKLYRNVMKEIHGALTALGYEIANPGTLVKIQQSEEPFYSSNEVEEEDMSSDVWGSHSLKEENMKSCERASELPLVKPDILLRVKMEEVNNEQACQTAAPKVEDEEDSNSAVFDPELSLWIKQEEEPPSEEREIPPLEEEEEEEPMSSPSTPTVHDQTGGTNNEPTSMSPRGSRPRLTSNKRTGLKLRDKILVLYAYENNETVPSLATQFGVSRSQIVQIIRRREELLDALQNNVSGDRIRRRRRTTNDRVNAAVWEWLLSTKGSDIPLSGRIIREKALQIARELGVGDFKASNGWLNSFKKTHNIHCYSLPFTNPSMRDKMDEWLSQMNVLEDSERDLLCERHVANTAQDPPS
uniref:HTH CENPB-type domain-containing protein n=1 Tax=Leptobrachium leishanense TaxID=445787 RepID=A0A8C5MJZ0_9ANUR